jgi:hypothetical protein
MVKQMSWLELENGNKELAEFGHKRFASTHVGYMATIRKDGSPRVHPMTPFIGEGHLFFFTDDGSLFDKDLQRDGHYALHCSVEDRDGGEGEFFVRGLATLTDDPDLRVIAERYVPYSDLEDEYILYELNVESAFGRVYAEGDNESIVRRWRKD